MATQVKGLQVKKGLHVRNVSRGSAMMVWITLSMPCGIIHLEYGFVAQDEYDRASRTMDLDYDFTEREQEPLYKIYFGKIVFLVQICILVGAAIMFGGSFTAERNGFEYSQTLR